jgi:inositol oxygenase
MFFEPIPLFLRLNCLQYRWHREGAYRNLMKEEDEKALVAVKAFNPYDLYSKSDEPVKPETLKPYYEGLIKKFFPDTIVW